MGGLKTDINEVQSQLNTTDSAIQTVQKSRRRYSDQSKVSKLMQDSQEELIKTYEKRYLGYYKK
ncbi:hypothetical protein ACEQPO_23935 [Bacillus sp. SL00103]